MIRYKLTTQARTTHNGFKWEVGKKYSIPPEKNGRLCSEGVFHSYEHPLLAVLLNPIHADIQAPRLWEVECSELVADDGVKGGHKEMMLVKELPLPVITTDQRVKFAILCSKSVFSDSIWNVWAENWLSGKNRTSHAADAAARAAYAADAAARAAYAAYAAANAARAADAAARVAYTAARAAARAASHAAYAAAHAARAASHAAYAAAHAATFSKKLIEFAEEVVK